MPQFDFAFLRFFSVVFAFALSLIMMPHPRFQMSTEEQQVADPVFPGAFPFPKMASSLCLPICLTSLVAVFHLYFHLHFHLRRRLPLA
jgi:hypothetical protein